MTRGTGAVGLHKGPRIPLFHWFTLPFRPLPPPLPLLVVTCQSQSQCLELCIMLAVKK